MDYAARLNLIIDTVGKSYSNVDGYTLAQPDDLASLRNANVFFTTSVLGMKAISHVIEDQAVSLGGSFRFYSSFQKFSRFKEQQERYLKIAHTANPVYILGLPDAELIKDPYLIEVKLEAPTQSNKVDLSQNWLVVLHNPQFVSMALLSREVPNPMRPAFAPDKLVYRSFEGFWTYDKEVINEMVAVLDSYINHRLNT